jgi:hypothetical protein
MHADGFAAKFSWRSSPPAWRHFVIPVAVVVIKSERLDAPGDISLPRGLRYRALDRNPSSLRGLGPWWQAGMAPRWGDENLSQVCNLQPARKIADWK